MSSTVARLLRWTLGIAVIEGSVLALLAWLLPGLRIASTTDLLWMVFGTTLLQAAA